MNKTFLKKLIILAISGAILVGLGILSIIYYKHFRGVGPALSRPVEDITELIENTTASTTTSSTNTPVVNNTNLPLKLPVGFSISIFAKNVPGSRDLAIDGLGNMWVSQTSEGVVSSIEIQNGQALRVSPIFKNLDRPHGLALDPEHKLALYIAEEQRISRVSLYSEDNLHNVIDFPAGGRHFTRTLGFGPEGRLYVSLGSTCDTCFEKDSRHAAIYSLQRDGTDFKLFAKGLRNAVFFTWHPQTKKMWATEMGRDFLGDNLPPEEVNIIEAGKDYGWPVCYGNNIQDTKFDPKNYTVSPCNNKTPPHIELPAHSAPLGLAFVPPDSAWPEEYWYNLFVAYHGSWNKSQPDGYKIVRLKLDKQGDHLGTEDFITGWLTSKGALGRPVDILVQSDGTMYVSDDKAGVIYKIKYHSSP